MEEYLVEMKETVDSLVDTNVVLHEDIAVWVAVKNLLKECDIMKQMILNDKLPTSNEPEMRLLSEEMSRKVQRNEIENEALFSYNNSIPPAVQPRHTLQPKNSHWRLQLSSRWQPATVYRQPLLKRGSNLG